MRHEAVAGPPVAVEQGHGAPRGIEASGASGDSRGATLRERELWSRDLKVRAEEAANRPDGEPVPLPSFEYSVGPDGRLYASGAPPPSPGSPPDAEVATSQRASCGPEPPPAGMPRARDDSSAPERLDARHARDPTIDEPRDVDQRDPVDLDRGAARARALVRAYNPGLVPAASTAIDTIT